MDDAERDTQAENATMLPFEKPAGNWPGKTYASVSLGSLPGPPAPLVVDLDSAATLDDLGKLDLGKLDPDAMRRAVDRATTGYDFILIDTPPPAVSVDPEQWKTTPDGDE